MLLPCGSVRGGNKLIGLLLKGVMLACHAGELFLRQFRRVNVFHFSRCPRCSCFHRYLEGAWELGLHRSLVRGILTLSRVSRAAGAAIKSRVGFWLWSNCLLCNTNTPEKHVGILVAWCSPGAICSRPPVLGHVSRSLVCEALVCVTRCRACVTHQTTKPGHLSRQVL